MKAKSGMKPKTVFKMFVDLAMLVIYLLLTFNYSANTLFHEIAGIAIGALFAVHVVINWKPVKNMWKKAAAGKLSFSRMLLLMSDIILPFGMAICIVTGMLIAKDLYIGPGDVICDTIHTTAAYGCLGILAVHTLLHAKYLLGMAKQALRSSFAQKTSACVGAVLMVGTLLGSDIVLGASDRITAAFADPTAITATAVAEPTQTATATVNDRQRDTAATGSTDTGTSTAGATTADTSTTNTATAADTATDTSATASSSSSSDTSVAQSTASSSDTSTTVLNCTQCHKNCPITALQCAKGTSWATANGYI